MFHARGDGEAFLLGPYTGEHKAPERGFRRLEGSKGSIKAYVRTSRAY